MMPKHHLTRAMAPVLSALLLPVAAHADLGNLLKELAATPTAPALPGAAPLAPDTVARGLKEALGQGTRAAIARLGREGGFLNDPTVRIAMPEPLAKVEKTLRKLGQDKYADQFVASMNQAAERAVPEAAVLFTEALAEMSVEDALAILRGPDDAATQYFRQKSEARLSERILPLVAAATDQAGVTSAYKAMIKKAGPLAAMLGAEAGDLDAYITARTLDGLFLRVAEEERAIRANPVARTTDLLKQVFGGLFR